MRLISFLYGLKVIHLHVKRLLILAEVLCSANKFSDFNLVAVNRFYDVFDWLCLIQVLRLVNFFQELQGCGCQLGHFLRDLLPHLILAPAGLLLGLAELVAQLGLELVGGHDLSLSTLLLLADELSVDAQFKNAGIERDCVFDVLKVLIDVLHALHLADISADPLRILADSVDLLLKPALLCLDPRLDSRG